MARCPFCESRLRPPPDTERLGTGDAIAAGAATAYVACPSCLSILDAEL